TSDGYFLFFYPWLDWLRGPWDLFVEHGHRLLASLVGVLTIAFCASVFLTKQPKWLRWMAIAAVLGVVLQGVLGGMRVLFNERTLAMIHGCVGPAFFALTAALAAMTSRHWTLAAASLRDSIANAADTGTHGVARPESAKGVVVMALALPVLAYTQIVLGAQLRHFSTEGSPLLFRAFVLFHVVIGIALAIYIVSTAIAIARTARHVRALTTPSALLVLLIIVQLVLGAATWVYKYNFPAFMSASDAASAFTVHAMDWRQAQITTAHMATGSLILAISTVLALRTARLVWIGDDKPQRTQGLTRGNKAGHLIPSAILCALFAKKSVLHVRRHRAEAAR